MDNIAINFPKSSFRASQPQPVIESGIWYLLANQHVLFCGDTARSSFYQRASGAKLTLAIPPRRQRHDWLTRVSSTLVLLRQSSLKVGLIEQTLLLYSEPGDQVLFPWLPEPTMLATAHRLGRRVVAGDPDASNCSQAIVQANLEADLLVSGENPKSLS